MNDYIPPFEITNTMFGLVASIMKKIGKLDNYKDLNKMPILRRNNRIRSIHSSLAIEDNSLSFKEVKDIIDGKLVIGNQKEIQEVKNAYKAYEMLKEINPYSMDDLKKIHGVMTFLTVQESGEFRKGDEGVFDDDKCIHVCPKPEMVTILMEKLFSWMKKNKNTLHPLILSSVFHYEFVFIHPFSDENELLVKNKDIPFKYLQIISSLYNAKTFLMYNNVGGDDYMIYITGDKHANFSEAFYFCYANKTTLNDILIVLGDAGINYYANQNDYMLKNSLLQYPITFFCIHGNHEERPENIKTYKTKTFHKGTVYYEKDYPNILFAKDGEIYEFNGKKVLVIGGAYSVDKYFRLERGYNWYESEQPNEKTKEKILRLVDKIKKVDIILTHTCPYKYLPREMFITGIDQSTVDNSTEEFLDKIEEKLTYHTWYCGHYHTDKKIEKIRFMFHDIDEFK